MMVLVFAWVGAGANEERECIRYAPPTATPIPPERIYSEWIPMPGYSRDMGKGWINAREIRNHEWTHNILSDAEYAAIERKHGMRQSMGSEMGYAFPPRIDFNTLDWGVLVNNPWLPERLR